MCSETDFTQETSHFHPTTRIPNSSYLFAAALSQNGKIAVQWRRKGHEKCICESPHNEIKCVLSILESYSIEKKWVKIFTFAYGQG